MPRRAAGTPLVVFDDVNFRSTRASSSASSATPAAASRPSSTSWPASTRPAPASCFMDGREVAGPSLDRGVVFQGHALMPWLTVLRRTSSFAVKSRWPDVEQSARSTTICQRYHRPGRPRPAPSTRSRRELSGGMKQRVGIARAFAIEPKMLLLDEPFGALDALTRGVIQDELLKICAATHQTVFMITHDVDEAILLADRIMLMSNGPHARIAEIVDNTLPRDRARHAIHKRPAVLPDPQPPGRFPGEPLEGLTEQPRDARYDRRSSAGGCDPDSDRGPRRADRSSVAYARQDGMQPRQPNRNPAAASDMQTDEPHRRHRNDRRRQDQERPQVGRRSPRRSARARNGRPPRCSAR